MVEKKIRIKLKDCEDSCPVPPPPPVEKSCNVWGIDCVDLGAIVLFIVLTSSFLITLLMANVFRKQRIAKERLIGDGNSSSFFSSLFSWKTPKEEILLYTLIIRSVLLFFNFRRHDFTFMINLLQSAVIFCLNCLFFARYGRDDEWEFVKPYIIDEIYNLFSFLHISMTN